MIALRRDLDVSPAYIKALQDELIRLGCPLPLPSDDIILPGLILRPSRNELIWNGQRCPLSARELELINVLARAYPGGLTRAEMQVAVWGNDYNQNGNVGTYLMYLGRDIPGLIVSSRAFGGGCQKRYWLALVPGDEVNTSVALNRAKEGQKHGRDCWRFHLACAIARGDRLLTSRPYRIGVAAMAVVNREDKATRAKLDQEGEE